MFQTFFARRISSRLLVIALFNVVALVAVAVVGYRLTFDYVVEERLRNLRVFSDLGRQVLTHHHGLVQSGAMDEASAKAHAIALLREMRRGDEHYYFVDTDDLKSVLLPIRPELEGTDVSQLKDSTGLDYVREQRDVARRGGGYVDYEFYRADVDAMARKISYIQPFTPWGWFIGIGVYLDDVHRQMGLYVWRAALLILALGAVSALTIFLVARQITRPLERLRTAIPQLRSEKLALPALRRGDEVGDIARALSVYRDTLLENDRLQAALQARERDERQRRDDEKAAGYRNALRLEQTARLVTSGEVALSIAHELNQPLAAVHQYCEGALARLDRRDADLTAIRGAMERASAQARRASLTIARLRSFLDRPSQHFKACSLPDVIAEVARGVAETSGGQDARIEIAAPPALHAFHGDPLLVQQGRFNLVRNAIEAAGPAPARIDIACALREDGMIECRVRDHGPGVALEQRPRLFDAFVTTKREGMGVGLNICRSIVEHHGGQLWHETPADGGAAFCFTLKREGGDEPGAGLPD